MSSKDFEEMKANQIKIMATQTLILHKMEELERVIHHANETKQRKCDTSQENNPTTEAKETKKTQSSRKAQKLKIDRVIENEDDTIGFVVRNVEYQSALFCALTTNGYERTTRTIHERYTNDTRTKERHERHKRHKRHQRQLKIKT